MTESSINIDHPEAEIRNYMRKMGEDARAAGRQISRATTAVKNAALLAIAEDITSRRDELMRENEKDLAAARQN
ncbi:MAG: gamma-glutamyl-phosphate reductase, partial [Pseudomonadales bacterium]|nr:gamma-glutamyl-phosphate reductase [Pseudomonadales bacterium]